MPCLRGVFIFPTVAREGRGKKEIPRAGAHAVSQRSLANRTTAAMPHTKRVIPKDQTAPQARYLTAGTYRHRETTAAKSEIANMISSRVAALIPRAPRDTAPDGALRAPPAAPPPCGAGARPP